MHRKLKILDKGVQRLMTEAEVAEYDARVSKYAAEEAERAKTYYKEKRQEEFASAGDQLDAIWEHIKYQRDSLGVPLTPKTEEMLNSIESIKTKYKKPE